VLVQVEVLGGFRPLSFELAQEAFAQALARLFTVPQPEVVEVSRSQHEGREP
jgi:hypothetical protein